MFTLSEIIEGLKAGKSFERRLEFDDGKEYLIPAESHKFQHNVAGKANGGWGGTSQTVPVEALDNRRWEQTGWTLSK